MGESRERAADDILTRDEVATWLKLRPRQVERFKVPAIRLGKKTVRYRRRDVVAWLEAHRSTRPVAAT